MNAILPSAAAVEELCAQGRIGRQDLLALRRAIFPDGVVSEAEAEMVFRLDRACPVKDPDWTRFYVDALTDYFVWQSAPRGYVSDAQAQMLAARISQDGCIAHPGELELLINVIHWAVQCPPSLGVLALKTVAGSIMHPQRACYGSNRPQGVILPDDVEIIRKIVYAGGSPGGFTVTLEEAELLIALDRASLGQENAGAWPDLFAKALANALMFPRGAPLAPDGDIALRREKWLERRDGIGTLLLNTGKAAARGDIAFDAMFDGGAAQAARDAEARRVSEALAREAIDNKEARWLIERMGDRPLSPGAIALLRFIRVNAPKIDPALESLMVRAGL